MSMILRFPIERVRPAHISVFESEEATILILPVVQVERKPGEENALPTADGSGSGGGRRRARRH
jgi:hypothetical protein